MAKVTKGPRFALGFFVVLAVSAAVLAGAAVASAPVIKNGGFETGDFTGWAANTDTGFALWQVYTDADPGLPPPPRGGHAATESQGGPATPILSQGFKVPKHAKLTLISGYHNLAPGFATPHDLNARADANHGIDNQQYRIDLIRAHARLHSVDNSDVLKNLFRTKVGDPQTMHPKAISADLAKFDGQSVKLRFAVAANQGGLQIEVDGVKVKTSK